MQILYSYYKSEGSTLESAQNELQHSIQKSYEQYLLFLQIPTEVTDYARSIIEKRRQKHLPSQEDLNPNTRFIDNQFVAQLNTSTMFNKLLKDTSVSWANNEDIIPTFYKKIVESDLYNEYMSAEDGSYEADKNVWVRIFKNIIYRSEELGELLEDMSIYWNDDAELVLGMVQKTIKAFEQEKGEDQGIMVLYKDLEDKDFAIKLLNKAIRSEKEYSERIDKKTEHWEADRIAFLDRILMQLALTEVENFSSIPIKVTINEYLDIAKSYSTVKSSIFINGVLDSIIKDMKKEDLLKKSGRGLME